MPSRSRCSRLRAYSDHRSRPRPGGAPACPAPPPPPARASTRPGRRGGGRPAAAGRRSTPGRAGRARWTIRYRRSSAIARPSASSESTASTTCGRLSSFAWFNSRTTDGRFAVPAAHRLGQQPAHRARVRQFGDRVGEGARHRSDRNSGDLLGGRQRRRADDPCAARRAQPAQPGDQDVDLVQRQQRGSGCEAVQGQRRQPRDHRLRVRRRGAGRPRPAGPAPRPSDSPRRVHQHRVQPLLAGRRARVEQEDAREDLLPGPAGRGTARSSRRTETPCERS